MGQRIETDRLDIEPFNDNFLTLAYVSWLSDPIVVRYSDQRFRAHSIDSCRSYISGFDNSPSHLWAIVIREGKRHIGNIAATVDPNHNTADISILIGETDVWGQGYGCEAWTSVMNYLFDSGIRKVTGGTLACNYGMLSIMQKSQMQYDGRRTNQNLVEGQPVDMVYFGKFA